MAAAVTFLGAFLLFFLEPFSAKLLLPWFGGGSQVWLACMLFFQALLLAGYGYAHLLLTRCPPRRQVRVHGLVLAAGLASLAWAWAASGRPLTPPARWLAAAGADPAGLAPAAGIQGLLLAALGGCVLPLAATTPLVQAWHLRAGGGQPYRLYALSNAGSLLGLLVYPFLVEPWLTLGRQAWVGAGLFAAYALGLAILAWRAAAGTDLATGPAAQPPDRSPAPGPGRAVAWGGMALAGALLLGAVTNVLTTEWSGLPLLWVLPLVVYLATFILAFDGRQDLGSGRVRALTLAVFILALAATPAVAARSGPLPLVGTLLAALFAGCLFCHGRLYALRPAPERLSGFYLTLSLGGVLGGAVVAVAAPLLFDRMWEFPLAVAGIGAVAGLDRWRGGRRWPGALGALACLVLAAAWGIREIRQPDRSYRDFYGQVKVASFGGGRIKLMLHGRTLHGIEDFDHPGRPLAYYRPGSGIARAIAALRARKPGLRLGVLGLGVGDVLAHARPGDSVQIYEISPQVLRLSGPRGREFTLVRDCPAVCTVQCGDGRLLLARQPPQGFDVLLVDAFSGGNLPANLLTLEALALYRSHLAPGGLLVLNATNRLPVDRVMLAGARDLGLGALVIDDPAPGDPRPLGLLDRGSRFVVMAADPRRLLAPGLVEAARAVLLPPLPAGAVLAGPPAFWRGVEAGRRLAGDTPSWTDDRNSLSRLVDASLLGRL